MAFVGLIGIMIGLWIVAFSVSVMSIIIGTLLKNKTKHKVLGTVLRIIGFVLIIPVVLIAIMFIVMIIK